MRSTLLGFAFAGALLLSGQHLVKKLKLQADAASIKEFALPNANSGPTTITFGSDGNLWFTESSGNRIGRIAPDGSGLQEFALPHAGSAPRIIALGSDKNIWFSEHEGSRIGRMSPKGQLVEFTIPTADFAAASRDCAGGGWRDLVWRVQGRQDRACESQGLLYGVSDSDCEQRASRAGGGGGWEYLVLGVQCGEDRAHHDEGCDYGVSYRGREPGAGRYYGGRRREHVVPGAEWAHG